MKTGRRWRSFSLVVGLAVLAALTACVDGEVVYSEDSPWDEASAGALGFLGYSDPDAKITACGRCHPGSQAEWEGTDHAGAWETLQASGHAAAYCEPCHSVSQLGNATTDANVGLALGPSSRYLDVQCESCHGPGILHVQNPKGPKPLVSFEAGADAGNGCGECHNGTHHPFLEQWAQSAHGAGPNTEYAGGRGEPCASCHEGQRALEAIFGVEPNYLETGDGELRTITCVVCHDAHGSIYEGQLRASIEVPTSEHLCVRCHSRRGTPWSSHGPHAAQGLLIFGEDVGYLPTGFNYPNADSRNNHGPLNNPGLCATCHVTRFTVTDPGGDFLFESVGHTFAAANCLDSNGIPQAGGDCAAEAPRSYAGCVGSGCHGSESLARVSYLKARRRITVLLDELWADTDQDHVMEATDDGLLPQVIALGFESDLNPDDDTMNPAKGALWNAMLAWTHDRPQWSDGEVAGAHFSSHPNSGNGVHNPHLLEALLLASIGDVRRAYGAQPSPIFDPTPQLAGSAHAGPTQGGGR